jgi:hypothetical protein
MKIASKIIGTLLLATLAACGGGGGGGGQTALVPHTPVGGVNPPSSHAVGTVTAQATVTQGLALAKSKYRRMQSLRATMGYTISSVEVKGILYPGYAGATPITNSQTLTPVNGAISISLTFSNVPAGNNEWMMLDLLAVAPDGSKFDLGQLASLVNVSASSASSVTLGAASTQTFEIFNAFNQMDGFSSVDMQDPAQISTDIAAAVTASGQTPDAATQLFTPLGLDSIFDNLKPKYTHNLAIQSPFTSGPQYVIAMPDYTNASENYLNANRQAVGDSSQLVYSYNYYGPHDLTPCWLNSNGNPPVVGPGIPTPPKNTDFCQSDRYAPTNGLWTLNDVYGGPVMAGATNVYWNSAPFTGGWISVASIPATAAGANPTLVTAPSNTTDMPVTVNDAEALAFNCNSFNTGEDFCDYYTSTQPGFANPFFPFNNGWTTGISAHYPNDFGSADPTLDLDTWGFANEPLAGLALCGNSSIDPCNNNAQGIGLDTIVSSPANMITEYVDPGSNFSYYNYQPVASTGVTAVGPGDVNCWTHQGIVVNTDGTSNSGSFTTTTPTYMGASASSTWLEIDGGAYVTSSTDPTNPCAWDDLSAYNATYTATVTATDGTVYTGKTDNNSGNTYAEMLIDGLSKTIAVKSITISYAMDNGAAPPAALGVEEIETWTNCNNCAAPRHGATVRNGTTPAVVHPVGFHKLIKH